jgi:hypothetical protein
MLNMGNFMSSARSNVSFFSRTKKTLSSILRSAPVTNVTSVIDGAIKAAFGIHYVFDLGVQLFPLSSHHMTAFKGVKYSVSGVTFAIASYYESNKLRIAKKYSEKTQILKENCEQGSVLIENMEDLIKHSHKNAEMAGYAESKSDDVLINVNLTVPEVINEVQINYQAKSMLLLKASFNGVIISTGVYYLFDIGATFITASHLYKMTRNVLMGVIATGKMFVDYDQEKMELLAKLQMSDLNKHMNVVIRKMKVIEHKLGGRANLLSVLRLGEQVTGQAVHLGIPASAEKISESKSALSESKPILMMSGFLKGAVNASGVHYMLEICFPELYLLRYSAAIITLLLTGYRSYVHNLSDLEFHHKIQSIQVQWDNIIDLITIANKIILLEDNYLEKMQIQSIRQVNPAVIAHDQSLDDFLAADFHTLLEAEKTSGDEVNADTDLPMEVELSQISDVSSEKYKHGFFYKPLPNIVSASSHLLTSQYRSYT